MNPNLAFADRLRRWRWALHALAVVAAVGLLGGFYGVVSAAVARGPAIRVAASPAAAPRQWSCTDPPDGLCTSAPIR